MTQSFLDRVWQLRNDERPAVQFNVQADTGTTMLERFEDVGKMMRHQLAEMAGKAGIVDDSVPAFFPYLGTAIFPSAFGCPVQWYPDQDPWARPILRDARDVYDLPEPAVTDGDLARALDYTRAMAAAPQRLPVRMTDVQGPLGIASLIWGEEGLMMAMYDAPDAVHHLMAKVTRLIIAFVMEQRRIVHAAGLPFIPCHFPPIWMPDGTGIAVSDDMIALLSPRMYAEFALPYMNRLAEAFGGIMLHSCGDFQHNLGNVRRIHNLRGVDFAASETPFGAMSDALAEQCVLSVRLGLNKEIHFPTIPAFVQSVLAERRTNRGLYLIVNLWYSLPGSGTPLQPGDVERMAGQVMDGSDRHIGAVI